LNFLLEKNCLQICIVFNYTDFRWGKEFLS
jgi:hypothetical protein